MNRMTSLFVCVLIVVLGNVFLAVHAQVPEADPSQDAAAPAEPVDAENSLLVGSIEATPADAALGELCQCVDQRETAATKRIEQALNAPLHLAGIAVDDMPLSKVISQLQGEYVIPIQIDAAALEDAGVGLDVPVTMKLQDVSLRSGLKLILERLKLTWIIRDEVLMITTTEKADNYLVTCVYNVKGLVDESNADSIGELIDAIVSCVAPNSWAENGGPPADIRALQPGVLIISQTPAIHEEVTALMTKIRKIREQVPIIKSRPQQPDGAPRGHSSNDTWRTKRDVNSSTAGAGGGGLF